MICWHSVLILYRCVNIGNYKLFRQVTDQTWTSSSLKAIVRKARNTTQRDKPQLRSKSRTMLFLQNQTPINSIISQVHPYLKLKNKSFLLLNHNSRLKSKPSNIKSKIKRLRKEDFFTVGQIKKRKRSKNWHFHRHKK